MGAHITPTSKMVAGSTTLTVPMRAVHNTAPLALHTSATVVLVTRLGQQFLGRKDTEPMTAPRTAATVSAIHGFRSPGPETMSVTAFPSVALPHSSPNPHEELDTHGCAVARFGPKPLLDENAPTSDTSTPSTYGPNAGGFDSTSAHGPAATPADAVARGDKEEVVVGEGMLAVALDVGATNAADGRLLCDADGEWLSCTDADDVALGLRVTNGDALGTGVAEPMTNVTTTLPAMPGGVDVQVLGEGEEGGGGGGC